MKVFFSTLFLSLLFLLGGVHVSLWAQDLGCTLKVRSDRSETARRLDAYLAKDLEAAPDIVLRRDHYSSLYGNFINIELTYPIEVFSGLSSLRFNFKDRIHGERVLFLSHTRQDSGELSVEQFENLCAESSRTLLETLRIENALSEGEPLKAGYFANKRLLFLDTKALDVEVLTHKLRPTSPSVKEILKEKQQSKEVVGSFEQAARASTESDLQKSHNAIVEAKSPALLHDLLNDELQKTRPGVEQAKVHEALARLDLSEFEDLDAASEHTKAALAQDPESLASIKMQRKLEGAGSSPEERFQGQLRRLDIKLAWALGVKYDSNAVKEAIDPFYQTDKEDYAFTARMNIEKNWQLGDEFYTRTIYDLDLDDYAVHSELDTLIHGLRQSLGLAHKYGQDYIRLEINAGLFNVINQGHTLLNYRDTGAWASWYWHGWATQFRVGAFFRNESYKDRFYDHADTDGDRSVYTFSFLSSLDSASRHRIGGQISKQESRPNRELWRYDEQGVALSYQYGILIWGLDSLEFGGRFYKRDYLKSEPFYEPRKDDRYVSTLKLKKQLGSSTVALGTEWTNNRSNRYFNSYRRELYTFELGLKF